MNIKFPGMLNFFLRFCLRLRKNQNSKHIAATEFCMLAIMLIWSAKLQVHLICPSVRGSLRINVHWNNFFALIALTMFFHWSGRICRAKIIMLSSFCLSRMNKIFFVQKLNSKSEERSSEKANKIYSPLTLIEVFFHKLINSCSNISCCFSWNCL